jgi:argininosuccinate lyase
MAGTPFTNTIEVGTEAVAGLEPGWRAAEESVALSQVLVSGARPRPDRMLDRAETGFTTATSVANRLTVSGVPFRTAHHEVGAAVRKAVAAGSTAFAGFGPPGWLDHAGLSELDPRALVAAHRYGGGPGDFAEPHREAVAGWAAHRQWLADRRHAAADAAGELADAVTKTLAMALS